MRFFSSEGKKIGTKGDIFKIQRWLPQPEIRELWKNFGIREDACGKTVFVKNLP